MTSITYVGMDVHTTNYTLCCYSVEDDRPFAQIQLKPEYTEILKYLDRIKKQRGSDTRFICGYEAGCLGYSLYHQLTNHGVECIIMAPTTMPVAPGKWVKTDRKDAENISRCLAYHLYKPVHIPTDEDDSIKEYIRMRDDVNAHLKQTKQQILSFCTRHGYQFDGKSYWTQKHLNWLEKLVFENDIYRETLWEYLALYYQLDEKIAVFDTRIAEFSHRERYTFVFNFEGLDEVKSSVDGTGTITVDLTIPGTSVGDVQTVLTRVEVESAEPVVAHTFTGIHTIAAYNMDAEVVLTAYDDGSCTVTASVAGNTQELAKGTYVLDGHTFIFSLEGAEEMKSSVDGTGTITVQLVLAGTAAGDIDTVMTRVAE